MKRLMAKLDKTDILITLGLLSIAGGVGWVSVPAGMVVTGVMLVGIGVLATIARR